MKFRLFTGEISFLFSIFFLFFFLPGIFSFGQTHNPGLTKIFLEAEVIFHKEFNKKRIKEEILKNNTIPEADMEGFREFVLAEYSIDKDKFFSGYTQNQLNKANLPSYFSLLRAKYISLYKVYQSKKETDDFSLFYRQGAGGSDEVMGPGQPCTNTDFEQCNFNNWDLYTGNVPGNANYSYNNIVQVTPPEPFHTITTAGFDPVASASNPAANISQIYLDGGTCSALLGDATGVGAKGASMKQTFLVDSQNAVFTYSYAAFLQDPTGHATKEKPYFRVKVYNSGGASIPCGEYNVIAGSASSGGDPTFTSATYNGETLYYKDWTTVFAPLNAYIGQNVTVEFTAGDCSQGGHFGYAYVEANCQPLNIISSSPVICGGQSVTLSAPPGAATYAWTGPNGFTANTQTITTSTAGTYSVTLTPVSGSSCAITLTTTIATNPSLPVANFSATSPCIGNPTAFTDLSSVSPGSITNWSWDFGESGIADTSNLQNPTYTYTTAGSYTVTLNVTTSAGCVQDTSFSVNVVAGFDATFTPDTLCNDESPVALSSLNPGGVWSGTGITNTSNGTFNPSTSGIGTFPVTYMGGTGLCKDTFIANVIVDGVAISNLSSTNISCFGANDGTISITATGAVQYSINSGTGPVTQSNGNFSGLAPGTYSIVVTSAINNCQKTSTVTITEPTLLVMAFQAFDATCYNYCDGEAIAIPSGGTSPYVYSWSNGTGNVATTGKTLCDGAHSISVSDANNCQTDTNFTILEPSDFSIVITTVNSNCGHPDGSASVVSIAGQTAPYNYLWSNNDMDSTDLNITDGDYSVTITDANGCDTVMDATVGFNPPPDAAATSITTSCFGVCDGSATVTGSNGTTPGIYTYLWNNGQTTTNASGLCAGSYTVTVFDANMCEGYASVIVQQPTAVTVTAFPDTTICISTSGVVGASGSGGNGAPYTYTWDIITVVAPDTSQSVSPAGPTCYTVSVTDVNGCPSNSQTQCISLYPPLTLIPNGTTTICEGQSTDISAFAMGGNPNNYPLSFTWSTGGNSSSQTVIPAGNSTSPVTYYVTVSDGCSPIVTDSVIVSFYPQPVAAFSADTFVGCEPVPVFNVDFTNTSTVNNPVSCVWIIDDGSPLISNCGTFSHDFPLVGSYDVSLTVISEDGCQDSHTEIDYITVNPNPVADFFFTPQPTDVQNMSISFTDLSQGNGINQWQWSFYDNDGNTLLGNSSTQNSQFNFSSEPDNPFIYYLSDTGDYPVTLWINTAKNCKDSITQIVKIDGVFYVNVPNAFTPNADGINDYFFPSGIGILPEEDFRFLIFNRWGDIIFESNSLNDPWDGTARALGGTKLVKQDVYVWRVQFKDVTRERAKHTLIGHVTLLK